MQNRSLRTIVSTLIIIMFLVSACGGGRQSSHKWKSGRKWTIKKVSVPRSNVKLTVNDRVKAWMSYFTGPGRERFGRYLQRAARYKPLMQEILRQHNVPDDVIHIALIESGFTASATSHASAVGFWQFIGSTGRGYGLRIDPYVDERRDFVKATHAAANYMADLYNEFGDWYLAFAGYNSGEGKVRRAIKKYGTKNFWKLTSRKRRHFRAETKDYVPKFIAATIIAKNPRKYGFKKIDYHDPIEYDTVKATSQTDFKIIAKCARTKEEHIAMLNPELLMGVTPPGEKNYKIRVPRGRGSRFQKAFASLPKRRRLSRSYAIASRPSSHTVRRGESLSKIARKYKTSTRKLMAANNIKKAKSIFPGQKLVIPGKMSKQRYRPSTGSSDRVDVAAVEKAKPKSILVNYKVKKGDTIGQIAETHGVKIADLRKWNKIRGNRIFLGKKLKIYKPGTPSSVPDGTGGLTEQILASAETKTITKTKSVKYKIQSGDTLGGIANKHKVKVADIKKWNGLKNNMIHPGKSLIVGKKKIQVTVPALTVATVSDTVSVPKTSSKPKGKSSSYKVKSGDSWWSIARKNDMTVAELKALNPKVGKILKAGKKIRVAGSAPAVVASKSAAIVTKTAEPAPAPKKKATSTYKVKSGDTLYSISRQHAVSIAELTRLNNMSRKSLLKPGMKLKVSGLAAKKVPEPTAGVSDRIALSSVAPTPKASSELVKYKVKSGDTAWEIARKHKVSLNDIKSWNDDADLKKLKPGDIIKLKLAKRKTL